MRTGRSHWWVKWALGLNLVLGLIVLYIVQPITIRQLDLNIHDTYLRRLDPGRPSEIPILIDIDWQH